MRNSSMISNNAVIEENCVIGKNVTIEDYVIIKSGTVVKDNCIIHAGSKIGISAFAFSYKKGKRVRSLGKAATIIENNVDIGYNTLIQQGLETNTIIGENTFINNACCIGHDIKIGKNCVIGKNTSISGYVEIGEETEIAPSVTILNRVRIGKKSQVGIGSLVLRDIPDNTTVVGHPALEIEQYKLERKKYRELIGQNKKSKIIATRKKAFRTFRKAIKTKIKKILL